MGRPQLFKPGYGADLQVLKLEIGGDANSTDGSEPSIEHTRGAVNCDGGYEWWLAEQAKARNPDIELCGLAWAAPGWSGGGNFWSQDMVDYLMTWLGCAKQHGLAISSTAWRSASSAAGTSAATTRAGTRTCTTPWQPRTPWPRASRCGPARTARRTATPAPPP